MLFNVIGNAIFYEKNLKKNLDNAYNEALQKKAVTTYFSDLFGFLTLPLYKKQVEAVINCLKAAPNFKKANTTNGQAKYKV